MTLSQKIKRARERAGMTQEETARAMGISQQAYSQYESGKRTPKAETLGRIAIALNMNLEDLLSNGDIQLNDLFLFVSGATNQAKSEVASAKGSSSDSTLDKLKEMRGNIDSICSFLHGLKEESERLEQLSEMLFSAFYQLNEDGMRNAVERVQELTEIPRYRATEQPQEAADTTDDKGTDGE